MLTGGKVLIVDDDVRNIFALTSGLERHKLKVYHAESGKAGIEMLKDNPEIDLVLMDIMMPEMDGYETTRAIRLYRNSELPIIALTAKAMKGDREKCIEAGASDYIPKPIVLEELVALLRVWFPRCKRNLRRRQQAEMTGNDVATVAAMTPEVPQPDTVKILLVDDKPENLVALEAVLDGLGQELIKAQSGKDALRACLEHDFAAILLDVKMPDMDGFETAAMIREREQSQRHAHHLPHRPEKRRALVPRLLHGRGRLPVQTHRPRGAAIQGGGLRRSFAKNVILKRTAMHSSRRTRTCSRKSRKNAS